MSKSFNPLLLTLLVSLALNTSLQAAGTNPRKNDRNFNDNRISRNKARKALLAEEASELYDQTELKDAGLSKKAFQYAFTGYSYLVSHHLLNNENILTICDFSQSSRNK